MKKFKVKVWGKMPNGSLNIIYDVIPATDNYAARQIASQKYGAPITDCYSMGQVADPKPEYRSYVESTGGSSADRSIRIPWQGWAVLIALVGFLFLPSPLDAIFFIGSLFLFAFNAGRRK